MALQGAPRVFTRFSEPCLGSSLKSTLLTASRVSRAASTISLHPRTLSTPQRPRVPRWPRLVLCYSDGHGPARGARSIFIQTETTPNADALKFLPNHPVLPQGVSSPFIEYLSPRATVAPPYPSPLAAKLMAVDGVTSVFYGAGFITVTKAGDANWSHIRPEVFAFITETVTSGQPIVNLSERTGGAGADAETGGAGTADGEQATGGKEMDSLAYDAADSEVVGMIKELLETRIRPAIQEDGGDIEYRGFDDGYVLLKLRGACRTCDSSTVTLKSGIEGMLMHYIEEVKGVHQVLDQEEEVAAKEFAKFEEKLKVRQAKQAP